MATKPDKYPDWATDDLTDPSSGQPNVVEPPAGRKASGWRRREIPPRQWFNWLSRITRDWIEWFDTTGQPKSVSGSTTNSIDDTGHTHTVTKATQVQAEAGTGTALMTSERTKQAVTSYGLLSENNLSEVDPGGARENIDAQRDLSNRLEVFSGSSSSVDLNAVSGGYPGDGLYLVRAGTNYYATLYVGNAGGFRTSAAYLISEGGINTQNEVRNDLGVITANFRNLDTSTTTSANITSILKVG